MSNPSDAPTPDPREGLWDPERDRAAAPRVRAGKRKRALPKSRVSPSLWALIALVIVAAVLGVIF